MSASHRRRNRGGYALVLLGLVGLLAAFLPGVAGAQTEGNAGGGNQDCPAGTVLLAKFNYGGGGYVLEG
jgi:hypothetical protein